MNKGEELKHSHAMALSYILDDVTSLSNQF